MRNFVFLFSNISLKNALTLCIVYFHAKGGYTALYDYSEEGSLQDHYKTFSKKEKLMAAWRIARGLADVHTLGGGKKSAIVHADIHPRQYVSIHGEYYLTDFNTARLMRWDRLNNRRCPARMYNHPTDCVSFTLCFYLKMGLKIRYVTSMLLCKLTMSFPIYIYNETESFTR